MRWVWSANEAIGLCRLLPTLDVSWDDIPRLVSVEIGWLLWGAQITVYDDE